MSSLCQKIIGDNKQTNKQTASSIEAAHCLKMLVLILDIFDASMNWAKRKSPKYLL